MNHKVSAVKRNKFSDFKQLRYILNIEHVCEIFLEIKFVLCILTRNLPMHNQFGNFIFGTLPVSLFWRVVVLKCCTSHMFLHCAMVINVLMFQSDLINYHNGSDILSFSVMNRRMSTDNIKRMYQWNNLNLLLKY